MFFKLLILSLILVAFTILALGVKLLFHKVTSFTDHTCVMEDDELNKVGGCIGCEIKELANCSDEHK